MSGEADSWILSVDRRRSEAPLNFFQANVIQREIFGSRVPIGADWDPTDIDNFPKFQMLVRWKGGGRL